MSNVTAVTTSSPELALLQMIIENDHAQSEADKAARNSARDAQLEAMEDELEAMEDQADAIRAGAWVEGSLQIAGGGLTVASALADASPEVEATVLSSGKVATGLAEPMGDLFGRAEEQDAAHEAKQAAQEQEQASWLADDAESHRQKVEKHAEAILQQVQGILETQHATTVAVLSNF